MSFQNICIHMYMYIHVCMYVRTYVRMYVRTYVCMYVCMYVCVYVCSMYVHMYDIYIYIYIYIYICVCTYLHIHTHTHTHTHASFLMQSRAPSPWALRFIVSRGAGPTDGGRELWGPGRRDNLHNQVLTTLGVHKLATSLHPQASLLIHKAGRFKKKISWRTFRVLPQARTPRHPSQCPTLEAVCWGNGCLLLGLRLVGLPQPARGFTFCSVIRTWSRESG